MRPIVGREPSGALGPIELFLPEDDLDRGVRIGTVRKTWKWDNLLRVGDLRESIDGALGEIAVARAYGASWSEEYASDPAKMHLPDVGGTDVRATRYEHGFLPLRSEHDHAERAYSLVILLPRRGLCRIVGWIFGYDGMRDLYGRPADVNGDAFHGVPQDALLDPAWLPIRREAR